MKKMLTLVALLAMLSAGSLLAGAACCPKAQAVKAAAAKTETTAAAAKTETKAAAAKTEAKAAEVCKCPAGKCACDKAGKAACAEAKKCAEAGKAACGAAKTCGAAKQATEAQK